MKALGVFVGVALWDAAWAYYILATKDRRAAVAASCSAGLYLMSAFNIVLIGKEPWLAIPGALGAWFGTWLAVRPWR